MNGKGRPIAAAGFRLLAFVYLFAFCMVSYAKAESNSDSPALPPVIATPNGVSTTSPPTPKSTVLPHPSRPAFYVVTDIAGDGSAQTMKSVLATEVSIELEDSAGRAKATDREAHSSSAPTWVVPEPGWSDQTLLASCFDPATIGGVILASTVNTEDHFFIVLSEEITDVQTVAQIIACDQSSNGNTGAASLVGLILQLSDAGSTRWVIRQHQIGIPLIGIAGVASLWSKNANTKDVTVPLAAAAVFSNVGNQTLPGYLVPVRNRHAAKHVGDDLRNQLKKLCVGTDPLGTPMSPGLARVCSAIMP